MPAGRALDSALKQHGITRDIKIYSDGRHSFFNEDGGSYDKAAVEDSWTRVLKFFGEQIGP